MPWHTRKITRDMGKSLMEDLVIEKLSTVYDPEVPVNIWELGGLCL